MFREDNGTVSMMRVLPFIVTCSMMFGWLYVVITTGALPTLDLNSIILIIGLAAGKVIQKPMECKPACNGVSNG